MAVAIRIFVNVLGVVIGGPALFFGATGLYSGVYQIFDGSDRTMEIAVSMLLTFFGGFFTMLAVRDVARFRHWFT